MINLRCIPTNVDCLPIIAHDCYIVPLVKDFTSLKLFVALTFSFSPMAPAASRLVGTGVALGLAATTFVAPGHPNAHQSATLRGSKVDTSAAATQSNSHLASLAAAGVSLAAIGAATSRNRVNLKSASQVAETATPPPFLF
eukprot:s2777_g8.t1